MQARAQCVGARPMDAAMKAGTNLNIGMESVTRKPVTIPVSLAGFTAAIDKLEAIR
ncbi:invasion associated locus B family protein [Mesorhizobium sp. 131-2-1]|uniref:invasion associated locus B family protein n=1 Tax=Mesorhizobium sp. 131-2-1 TaxID=2744518 RepID=UPI00237C1A4E|nr:invasion associated locus B family protein [Mesorhizobium sp. 131-2-1]